VVGKAAALGRRITSRRKTVGEGGCKGREGGSGEEGQELHRSRDDMTMSYMMAMEYEWVGEKGAEPNCWHLAFIYYSTSHCSTSKQPPGPFTRLAIPTYHPTAVPLLLC
jgi:hypothetical protein